MNKWKDGQKTRKTEKMPQATTFTSVEKMQGAKPYQTQNTKHCYLASITIPSSNPFAGNARHNSQLIY